MQKPKVGETWIPTKLEKHTEAREIVSVTQFGIRFASPSGIYEIFWPGWNGWVRQHEATVRRDYPKGEEWRAGFSARQMQPSSEDGPELIEVVICGQKHQLYRNEFDHLKAALAAVA